MSTPSAAKVCSYTATSISASTSQTRRYRTYEVEKVHSRGLSRLSASLSSGFAIEIRAELPDANGLALAVGSQHLLPRWRYPEAVEPADLGSSSDDDVGIRAPFRIAQPISTTLPVMPFMILGQPMRHPRN